MASKRRTPEREPTDRIVKRAPGDRKRLTPELEARIVAVADAVEAMLSPRPHRLALNLTACLDELQSQAGRRYDARVVKACVKLLRDGQATTVPVHQEGEAAVGQRIA